jgi:hypothetical protein
MGWIRTREVVLHILFIMGCMRSCKVKGINFLEFVPKGNYVAPLKPVESPSDE